MSDEEQRPTITPLTLLQMDVRDGIKTVGERKGCCLSYDYEKAHTIACTSNEAVLGRGDPDAAAKKAATWARHRKEHGDPLARLRADIESGEVSISEGDSSDLPGPFTGRVIRVDRQRPPTSLPLDDKTPEVLPYTVEFPDQSRAFSFKPQPPGDFSEVPPGTDMTRRYRSFALCEICGLRQAQRPKERETVLTLFVAPFWRLADGPVVAFYRLTQSREGVRPLLGSTGRTEAIQLLRWGPLLLVVQGPSWGDVVHGQAWEHSWRLGRFFRTRPWICHNCQVMGDATIKRARGVQRRHWRSVLGRELRVLGNWLGR
jgi:hypothetical protein